MYAEFFLYIVTKFLCLIFAILLDRDILKKRLLFKVYLLLILKVTMIAKNVKNSLQERIVSSDT